MDILLHHGDHERNAQGFLQRADGARESIQQAMIRLSVPQGSFALDKNLGSRLHTLPNAPKERQEELALEYAQDSGVLFKSGIMQALQQLGLCDGIYTGLYHELFGWEPRGKCLHSPTYPPVREVLATAKAAGAVVVFAHPTVYKSMPLLRELVAEGAIDGIEVHHPRNSPEDMAECAELCKKHDLIVTGGSDFHGANHGKPHPVGACVTEDDQIARIEALARKRRGGAL